MNENEISPLFTFLIIVIGLVVHFGWLILIHQCRGGRYKKEQRSSRSLAFTTEVGDFRLDAVHQNFNTKPKGENQWQKIPLDTIKGIRFYTSVEDASWFEFFLSDWSIWDYHGRYRDITNTFHIELQLTNGSSVPLANIKQYEQREMWLGQYFHDMEIKLLKWLKLYTPVEEVGYNWITMMLEKFSAYDIELREV